MRRVRDAVASGSSTGFRIELLGPVEARVDGRAVGLGGQRPRALFAVLALFGGRVVMVDRLIDELWGEEPPARARDSLQMHVSRLRKGLAEAGADDGRLVSHAGGYRLEVRPGERDVDRWEQALDRARRARSDGEPRAAREEIEQALGVWRGEPLAGVSTNSLLAAECARLQEERLAAVIEGIELDLELGRHGELPGQLEALAVAHPFNERLVELQMLALYRCGRQVEALAAFQAARGRFVDELGIEPTQPLRELHENVLRHAAKLSLSPEPAFEAAPTTLSTSRLPVPPNRTIGREHDVVAVGARLRAESVRLLTLTGSGGVGKTRLAVEAARSVQADFADGAQFVSLAALHRPQDVPAAIVNSLGIIVLSGESPGQAAERFLAAKHLLLIADNFEQLLPAAPFIAGLLEACPSLTVLATSREPLALQAEEGYPVSPLALPEPAILHDPQAVADSHAVTLFCERARAHEPDFELRDTNAAAIAEICRRVDGLPLAIELAAARCGLLSPTEIADRLDTALGASGAGARDAPARHQTVAATIDWSHDLLDHDEKRCFACFAVFAGGATVSAAETVIGTRFDTLARLVAKSLIARNQPAHGATRLAMLETIRAYAAERFAAHPERDSVRKRHYRHCLALAQRHGTNRALWSASPQEHLARLDAEIDNLHAALAWAVEQDGAEPALAMSVSLGQYWLMGNRGADAVDWVDRALSLPGAEEHPALRVDALCIKGWALWHLGRGAEQTAVMAEAEAIARTLGDPAILSRALQTRAAQASSAGRIDAVDVFADEALHWARAAGDDLAIALAVFSHTLTADTATELHARVREAASLLEAAGDVYHLGGLFSSACYAALCNGNDRDAREFVDRAIPLAHALDNPYGWMLLQGNIGLAKLMTGDVDAGREAFREELRLCRELRVLPFASEGLLGLAAVAAAHEDHNRAARLLGASDAHAYGSQQPDVEARLDTAFFDSARKRHAADAWDAAQRHGAALSFDGAIAYALEESSP